MSIVSFKEIHSGRDGEAEVASSGRTIRRYTRVFRVITDDRFDGPADILAAIGVVLGDPHPVDVGAFCQKITPSNESFSKLVHLVSFSYSSEKEIKDNPLDDPVEIDWGGETFQRLALENKDGGALVNNAGVLYPDHPMRDDSRLVATIQANLALVPTWILDYRDVVNDATVGVDGVEFTERQLKVQDIRVSKVQERNSVTYRTVGITVAGRKDTWDFETPEAGFEERDPADPTRLRKIEFSDGKSPSQPWPLDAFGRAFALTPTPVAGDYTITKHRVYREDDLTVLPGIVTP